MRRLASFRYHEGQEKVALTIRNDRGNGKTDVTRFESNDPPKPELVHALQAMKTHLIELCEVPEDWAEAITVRGVTVSRKRGKVGLVIRAIRELEYSKTPLALNSPYATQEFMDDDEAEDDEDEDDREIPLSTYGPECTEALEELERLVFAYYDGDRQQLRLFKTEDLADDEEDDQVVGVAGAHVERPVGEPVDVFGR